jgi:PIN domain nuclease of toxin-antitoxin system
MNIILDTHIFLWLISEDEHLSEDKVQAIIDPNNQVFLSVVSVWECVIKYQTGKLDFPESPEIYLPEKRSDHLIKSLEIKENTIKQLIKLPMLHKDPFDRLIICQSLEHDLTIMTEDETILNYPNLKFYSSQKHEKKT